MGLRVWENSAAGSGTNQASLISQALEGIRWEDWGHKGMCGGLGSGPHV